jgi:3',5'-cyclic AMP phosphodiesterase CpdA
MQLKSLANRCFGEYQSMKRRSFLATLPLASAGVFAQPRGATEQHNDGNSQLSASARDLKFRADGTFKILAISDLHYIPEPDKYGMELTGKLISIENPDFVIVNGDNISGDSCSTPDDVIKTIANVAFVLEKMNIPWAVTLGNHDQEHVAKTHITREQVFEYYESYSHNLNGNWVRDIHGAGNKNILIWSSDGSRPVSNIWLIDSGEAVKDREVHYDWIHVDQIAWYSKTSKDLESRYGQTIPSLMFFHIPLLEFTEMILTAKVIGERHEPESPSRINGGMFSAVLERGDVKGIFCGHDHVNNYVGKYRGVLLGYLGVVGYHGYPHTPPSDGTNDRARGARVFLFNEKAPDSFKTWIRFRDGFANWEHWSDAYERDQIKLAL